MYSIQWKIKIFLLFRFSLVKKRAKADPEISAPASDQTLNWLRLQLKNLGSDRLRNTGSNDVGRGGCHGSCRCYTLIVPCRVGDVDSSPQSCISPTQIHSEHKCDGDKSFSFLLTRPSYLFMYCQSLMRLTATFRWVDDKWRSYWTPFFPILPATPT